MVISSARMCWQLSNRLFTQTLGKWLFFVLGVWSHIDHGEGVWHVREGHISTVQRKIWVFQRTLILLLVLLLSWESPFTSDSWSPLPTGSSLISTDGKHHCQIYLRLMSLLSRILFLIKGVSMSFYSKLYWLAGYHPFCWKCCCTSPCPVLWPCGTWLHCSHGAAGADRNVTTRSWLARGSQRSCHFMSSVFLKVMIYAAQRIRTDPGVLYPYQEERSTSGKGGATNYSKGGCSSILLSTEQQPMAKGM